MTDEEKIKLVATMAATIFDNNFYYMADATRTAVSILEETIKQLKEKGMIKNE
jgi:hypothetical protein